MRWMCAELAWVGGELAVSWQQGNQELAASWQYGDQELAMSWPQGDYDLGASWLRIDCELSVGRCGNELIESRLHVGSKVMVNL